MAIGQFSKSKATNGGPKAPPPATRKSKWEGVQSAKPRDPILHAGAYRLKVLTPRTGRNGGGGWFKPVFEIVDQAPGQTMHEIGDQVIVLLQPSTDAGQSRLMSLLVAMAGFDDDKAFIDWDAETQGEHSDAFERGEESVFNGRYVDVRVRRGKDTDDGDYFRECEWSPVADEEQPQ